ncbi:MAG: valine--tRNA ligase [Candidatus Daviesbacteria bacterium]|nr:valine--tRNA ligase [Candidatus Daviesbacteria bacterium]
MDKNNQQQLEKELYNSWEKSGLFKADPLSSKKPYSLLMPPPNLTGELHLGHAMQHSILDAIARFKRMQGFDVLLMPGVDHAGIQFEGALNKLLSKEGLTKNKLGREEWMKRALEFKDEVYQSFHKDWTVFGISADWSREVFTMDEKRSDAVFAEFKKYYDDGLVYKGAYIVQWCPKCGTAIEDVEMEYEEKKEKLYFVKYKIENSDDFITIATTRPETIYADTGIAMYPNHPEFKKFVGAFAINPLNSNKIPIFEDKRVDKDFGTGALKITPGHDPKDYEIGKDHNLPILHVVDKTGRMTELAQDLAGLKIDEAEEKAAAKLQESGALIKTEDLIHSVPVCERCKTTVEPLISEEWFIKMKPLADKALKRIGEVNFLPKNYKKILTDWIKDLHDWCISRDLWWGHRIPIWYHGDDIKVSQDPPGEGWVQEEKIFDTWFSSGLWPLSTLGWPNNTEEMKKYFPWDFEITAPEIKYLWIARMIMISLYLAEQIPFKNMFFHGMLRDLQGKKFSKSLGNGINPNDLRESWGTDSVRMALYSYSAPGRDGKTSRQLMDERCKNFRNFGTKIKNIYRFIYELKPSSVILSETKDLDSSGPADHQNDKLHPDDKKILEELNKTIKDVTKNLESFQLHLATEILYEFIWHKFADVYIEKSKDRRVEAQPVLEHVLAETLKLLHPFMPFTTEELWQKINKDKKSIMESSWPKVCA